MSEDIKSKNHNEELVRAFHLMWGNFPEPCTLVHKSKEVIAVNPVCELNGGKAGMICAKSGPPEAHKGCLANQAIATQKAQVKRIMDGKKEKLAFWLPITGYPDYYIHFGTRIVMDYV